MSEEPIFPYRFLHYEPALFLELYLPKKALYQGTLLESLTKGFRVNNVREHFKTTDPKKRRQINEMLDYESLRNYTDDRIDKMKPIKWGYSIYDVDGVFFSEDEERIIEERTQVIRIMFRFSQEHLMKECGIKTEDEYLSMREFIQSCVEHSERKRDKDIGKDDTELEAKVREYIDIWIDDVALLMLGYIVFNICADIKERFDKKELEYMEQEIWVSTFGNLQINRVILHKSDGL